MQWAAGVPASPGQLPWQAHDVTFCSRVHCGHVKGKVVGIQRSISVSVPGDLA